MLSKTKLFLDTSFVIALINERDQYHGIALDSISQYDRHPFVTTDAVLPEIGNALSRRYKTAAIQVIQEFMSTDNVEVLHLSAELFVQAFDLYCTYQDKEWGLVDCVSFVVMQDLNIQEVLTFDHHFVQAGFRQLPQ